MVEDWWRRAFTTDYGSVYAHRDDAAAEREVAGVLPHLRDLDGPILDACCGGGRHLAALQRAGCTAWGFDFSADLLRTCARRDQTRGRICRADLRCLPFADGAFAAVLLFFTSFGYFDDVGNAAVLGDLARVLRPGGLLLLDLPDPATISDGLVPCSERALQDGRILQERRSFDGQRVRKTVCLFDAAGRQLDTYHEDVRVYAPDEVVALTAAAGLVHRDTWRSLLGPDASGNRQVGWFSRR